MKNRFPTESAAEGEITLLDLWKMLRKRWRESLAIFLLVVAACVAWGKTRPVIYESRAVILLASHQQGTTNESLEAPAVLIERLKAHYDGRSPHAKGKALFLSSLEVEAKDSQYLLNLTAHSRDRNPEVVTSGLGEVVDEVIQEQQALFKRVQNGQQQDIAYYRARLDENQAQTVTLKQQINGLQKRDTSLAAVLTLEQAKLQETSTILYRELRKIEAAYGAMLSRSPVEISPPSPPKRITPGLRFYVVLGVITGVICALFGSLFLEILTKFRGA